MSTTVAAMRSLSWSRALRVSLVLLATAVTTAALILEVSHTSREIGDGRVGFDFVGTVLEPAQSIRDGRNPYPDPSGAGVSTGNPALYPPLVAVSALPLTALDRDAAIATWTVLLAVSLVLGLLVVGVRDWRCFVVAAVTYPGRTGLLFGNIAVLLAAAVALAWRARDRALLGGVAVGLAVALKLLLWPLFVWLLVTRRYRSFLVATGVGAAAILVPWAAIGFDGLADYPELLRRAAAEYSGSGYSLVGLFEAAGAGLDGGRAAALACAALLLVGGTLVAARGDDLGAFAVFLLAGLVASPIMWPYSYLVLVVPLAAARPRLGPAWLLLPAFVLADRFLAPPVLQPLAFTVVAAAICAVPVADGFARRATSPSPRVAGGRA